MVPFLKSRNEGRVYGKAVDIGVRGNKRPFWHVELEFLKDIQLDMLMSPSVGMNLQNSLGQDALWIHSYMCSIWFSKPGIWDEITHR